MTTVLVCDDAPMAREAVRRALAGLPGVERVTAAGSGEEVLARYPLERPDLILMDVVMPGQNGFQLTRAISRAMHGLVIFTDHATAPAFEQLGASPADSRTVHNFLDSCRPLMAFDREAVAKWKEIPFSEARSWVQDGLGSWADFRLSLSHWASEVPFSTARLWVENGLCSWAIFHEQLMEWTDEVSPAFAGLTGKRPVDCDSEPSNAYAVLRHAEFRIASQATH